MERNQSENNVTDVNRDAIDSALAGQEWNLAVAGLKQLFSSAPSPGTAQFVLSRMAKLPTDPRRIGCRLAVLRSFTIEPAMPLLRAAAALHGVDIAPHVCGFNAIAQEILDPNSAAYRFDPHIVLLAVQTRDTLPAIWNDFADLSAGAAEEAVDAALRDFGAWFDAFRAHSKATLLVHNLEIPPAPAQGVLDSLTANGQTEAVRRFNRELIKLAAQRTGIYVLDYDALVARHGRTHWHDERKWVTMRMPISSECLIHLAAEYLRFVLPAMGRGCKALVVDLDNTLWGGVVGEEGAHGVLIGAEHPGAPFRALQRTILNLRQRGILIAIASKNNEPDAAEVFRQNSGMLLRLEDFAATRINWNDKARSLREIAEELNIGADALAFLDDNPAERERIQQELPEVTVIPLPRDPYGYSAALAASPVFERLRLSTEDLGRSGMYEEQRQRAALQQTATSLEEYYRSLKQVAEIAEVSPVSLARIAQLTQKTNQFNLTTRRYTEAELEEVARTPGHQVHSLRVRDRFGDNGLVGVAITRRQDDVVEIDTFLLSCRVIGRTVETAFLAYLAEEALRSGARSLSGWFVPTAKNAPARSFYSAHGFQLEVERAEDGASLWRRGLLGEPIGRPDWIELHVIAGDSRRE